MHLITTIKLVLKVSGHWPKCETTLNFDLMLVPCWKSEVKLLQLILKGDMGSCKIFHGNSRNDSQEISWNVSIMLALEEQSLNKGVHRSLWKHLTHSWWNNLIVFPINKLINNTYVRTFDADNSLWKIHESRLVVFTNLLLGNVTEVVLTWPNVPYEKLLKNILISLTVKLFIEGTHIASEFSFIDSAFWPSPWWAVFRHISADLDCCCSHFRSIKVYQWRKGRLADR